MLSKLLGAVSIIDLSGNYFDVNEEYARLCGYEPHELVDLPWSKTVFEEDLCIANQIFADMVANQIASGSFRGISKQGELFNKEVTLIRKDSPFGSMEGHYCFLRVTS
jgi:PAS domain S-box-containing protein